MIIIYSNYLPVKGFRAINLFGIVFARKEYKELDERVLNHEAIHTRQMLELCVVNQSSLPETEKSVCIQTVSLKIIR